MQRGDGGVNLPRPYGEGFAIDDGLDDLIGNRLNRMEKARRFWGRLANTWIWTLARNIIPTFAIFTAVAVMAIPEKINPSISALIFALVVGCSLSPQLSPAIIHYGLDWIALVLEAEHATNKTAASNVFSIHSQSPDCTNICA